MVIIEGNSEIIIKALYSKDESFSSYGHLNAEAKLSTVSFYSFCVSHIHRQDNSVVHDLARHVSGLMMWMKDVPPHKNFVLLADFG